MREFVQLYKCHFLGGRVESAPKTRTQETAKVKVPEADALQEIEELEGRKDQDTSCHT